MTYVPWNKNRERTPEQLLELPIIPHHLLTYLPRKLDPMTLKQRQDIRAILNMRQQQLFRRCRGKQWKWVRAQEAKGDFSHSDKRHVCAECQCKQVAGQGTRGNFYGLGPETGHFGVYYCRKCKDAQSLKSGVALRFARREVELIQSYGTVSMDSEYALKQVKAEGELAEMNIKSREEMQLVLDELGRFRKMLEETDEDKKPTESSKGGAVPMSDKTRISLLLDVAKTISKLRRDDKALSEEDYILVDHVMSAASESQQAIREYFSMVEEFTVRKHVRGETLETDQPIVDYVYELFAKKWYAIWQRAKTRAGLNKGA